jgi:regulator of RNase E activity RraB
MSNQKVVAKLMEAGDKLDTERQVDHWLYFPNAKSRDSFALYAQAKGFKIESKEMRDVTKAFQLHISRVDKADLPSISKLTLELRREARKYDADYDGWETFVVR